jgi:hypothetical protein
MGSNPDVREIDTYHLPRLALSNEALLYAIFFLTALHMSSIDPSNTEAGTAYQTYLDMCLRSHRHDVAVLAVENADQICLTSSLIRIGAFAILSERPLKPYTPPKQWLNMTSASGDVFRLAWGWIADTSTSLAAIAVNKVAPDLSDDDTLFAPSNRRHLQHLLKRHPHHSAVEPWSPAIQEGYEQPIAFIGGVQLAIEAGEGPPLICRRLVAFPVVVPKRPFHDFVEEGRPRALIVLAHYFALFARYRDFWWIGETGRREVYAIKEMLESLGEEAIEWLSLMEAPIKDVNDAYR